MVVEQFNLSGKTALVTGGAGLLGRQFAHTLAEAGANVVVADIRGDAAEEVANSIHRELDGNALGIATDVTDKASVDDTVGRAVNVFGGLDILVNNAALDPKFDQANADQHTNAFEDFPLEEWQRGLDVDLTGLFLCAQAASKPMLARGSGRIVNLCSTYGLVGPDQRLYQRDDDNPQTFKPVIYSVTKSAVLGLTRYLAAYWGDRGIRVNALTPGGVYVDHDAEFVKRYSARTPLRRMADRSEYSGALLYLVSDASSYMTGSNLIVDGGWTAW